MMKLKNSKCSETQKTQKLKLWQNLKPEIVMKLKNSNWDESQKPELWWNSKTQILMKFKKLKLWQNSKTQIVTKLKLWQLKNSKCDKLIYSNYDKTSNSNCDKTQKLKLCQKLNLWWNSNSDETQIVMKFNN